MTDLSYLGGPASARRLLLALAASVCGHTALLANAPFAPGLSELGLSGAAAPLRVRLAAPLRAPDAAESLVQRTETGLPPPPPPPPRDAGAQSTTSAASAGLPAAEIFYRGREVDERAEATNIADLEYPEGALAAGTSGKVTLRLMIDHLGALREASVLEAQPPGVFDEAALRAVRALKFRAAIRNGVAVGSIKLIEVPFDPDCLRTGSCTSDAASAPRR